MNMSTVAKVFDKPNSSQWWAKWHRGNFCQNSICVRNASEFNLFYRFCMMCKQWALVVLSWMRCHAQCRRGWEELCNFVKQILATIFNWAVSWRECLKRCSFECEIRAVLCVRAKPTFINVGIWNSILNRGELALNQIGCSNPVRIKLNSLCGGYKWEAYFFLNIYPGVFVHKA